MESTGNVMAMTCFVEVASLEHRLVARQRLVHYHAMRVPRTCTMESTGIVMATTCLWRWHPWSTIM